MAKTHIQGYQLYPSTTVFTADALSNETTVTKQDQCTIPVIWTGNLTGTLTVEVKNGDDQNVAWRTLDMGQTITIDNSLADQSVELVFTAMPFTHLRLNFDYTSGTGAISAIITSKVVGA